MVEPELDREIRVAVNRVLDRERDGRALGLVDEREELGIALVERAGLDAEDLLELAAPPRLAVREVARPGPHLAAAHGEREHVATLLRQIVVTAHLLRASRLAFGSGSVGLEGHVLVSSTGAG